MSTLILILVILTGTANLLAVLILASLWREAILDLIRRIIAGLKLIATLRRATRPAVPNDALEDYADRLSKWNRGER